MPHHTRKRHEDDRLNRSKERSSYHVENWAKRRDTSRSNESILTNLTTRLTETYAKCGLHTRTNPKTTRRVLTKNSQVVGNNGWDNSENNIVLRVRDLVDVQSHYGQPRTFVVLDLLGQGTFGQVFRCQDVSTKELVAIKIIRNHPSYYNQALVEVQVSQLLSTCRGFEGREQIVELLDYFMFQNHLCLVFELLSVNLYELLSQNSFRGLPLTVVRGFLLQILKSLVLLGQSHVIHCDLKPENILLTGNNQLFSIPNPQSREESHQVPSIKLVDFGSACYENETVYSYIQSRFYRSPEVLLGLPYSGAIDMWSLGCISAEIFLGLPLFPGATDHDQLKVIIDTLGYPPMPMLHDGNNVHKFFQRRSKGEFVLKSVEEYAHDCNTTPTSSKRYFKYSELEAIINAYPIRRGASEDEKLKELQGRGAFGHFLRGLLTLDPMKRWTPQQAMHHPFITGQIFNSSYEPPHKSIECHQFHPPIIPMHHSWTQHSSPLNIPRLPVPYYDFQFPVYPHSCPSHDNSYLYKHQFNRPFHLPYPIVQNSSMYHSDSSMRSSNGAEWDPFFMQELEETISKIASPPKGYKSEKRKEKNECVLAIPSIHGEPKRDGQTYHRKWRRKKKEITKNM